MILLPAAAALDETVIEQYSAGRRSKRVGRLCGELVLLTRMQHRLLLLQWLSLKLGGEAAELCDAAGVVIVVTCLDMSDMSV